MKPGVGVACPECGSTGRAAVLDTRSRVGAIRRRRLCANGHRFTTYERLYEKPTPRQKKLAKWVALMSEFMPP